MSYASDGFLTALKRLAVGTSQIRVVRDASGSMTIKVEPTKS